jgi:endonuclease/exonuclease/phosphatase family metal-dependent hydrolase
VDYVEIAVNTLKPDIIAMQEVSSEQALQTLANRLDNYSYAYAYGGGNWGLAYLYNSSELTLVNDPYEIYTTYWSAFPRPPFVLEANWNGKRIVIINNHLKAYGDIENIERRIEAMELLDVYVEENLNDERVVILGDMNDELTDEVNNVFEIMLNDPQSYFFTDLSIAQGSNLLWSYPKYPSHIDHILITNELFTAHFETNTVLYDTYLDGRWTEYEEYISDHRPVAISLVISGE